VGENVSIKGVFNRISGEDTMGGADSKCLALAKCQKRTLITLERGKKCLPAHSYRATVDGRRWTGHIGCALAWDCVSAAWADFFEMILGKPSMSQIKKWVMSNKECQMPSGPNAWSY